MVELMEDMVPGHPLVPAQRPVVVGPSSGQGHAIIQSLKITASHAKFLETPSTLRPVS